VSLYTSALFLKAADRAALARRPPLIAALNYELFGSVNSLGHGAHVFYRREAPWPKSDELHAPESRYAWFDREGQMGFHGSPR
jgi:hypothetical protein